MGWCKPIIMSNPKPSYFGLLLGWVAVAWLGFGVMTISWRGYSLVMNIRTIKKLLTSLYSCKQITENLIRNIPPAQHTTTSQHTTSTAHMDLL